MLRVSKDVDTSRFGKMSMEQVLYKRYLFPHLSFAHLRCRYKTEEELVCDYRKLLYHNQFLLKHRTMIIQQFKETLEYYDGVGRCLKCQFRKRMNIIRDIVCNTDILLDEVPEKWDFPEVKSPQVKTPRKRIAKK